MVRAGVVDHPGQWLEAGYREIQDPRQHYRVVDRRVLCELPGVAGARLAALRNGWIGSALARGRVERELRWSRALAVDRRSFVERVQGDLGMRVLHRGVEEVDGLSILREPAATYEPHLGIEMKRLSQIQGLHSR